MIAAIFGAALSIYLMTSAAAQVVKRVSIDGTELAYVEMGGGDPVIFVHGGLQDHRMWAAHLPKFAERYRAIAYSRRNSFPNESAADGMPDSAADAHGEDLAALVRALGLSRVRVVAHSSGAHAALFFAASHPEMLNSLVLSEPPAQGVLMGTTGGPELLKEFGGKLAPAREAIKAGHADVGIPLFVDAVGGDGAYARRSEADKQMNRANFAGFQADAMTKRPRPVFTCDMAKAVKAPTLLLSGELSPRFFHGIVDQLAICLPHQRRTTIAGSSHTIPSEQRDAFDEAALAFLNEH